VKTQKPILINTNGIQSIFVIIFLLCVFVSRSQTSTNETLESLFNKAKDKLHFAEKIHFDSISMVSDFDFCTLKSSTGKMKKPYKLYFRNDTLVKLDFHNAADRKEKNYSILFVHDDSLVYYITLPRIKNHSYSYSYHLGIISPSDSVNIIFARHARSISSIESFEQISLKFFYLNSVYPVSIFLVDKNMSPIHRCFFQYGTLITSSYCKVYKKTCVEYLNASEFFINFEPFKKHQSLQSLTYKEFSQLKYWNTIFSTFFLMHTFDIDNCFVWEYYEDATRLRGLVDE